MRLAWLFVAACGGDGTTTMPDGATAHPDGTLPTPDAPVQPAGLRVFVSSLRYPADLRTAGGQATGRGDGR